MHAVVVAGGVPGPHDPLHRPAAGGPKALIRIGSKPMAQWVLDALDGARGTEAIFVVGLDPSSGLTAGKRLEFISGRGGLLANSKAGLGRVQAFDARAERALVLGADIPTLTPEIVDWRIAAASSDADLDYVVIERRRMEARFPGANRSYIRLREMEVCGSDINVARVELAAQDEVWQGLLEARKNAWRQAALIGWDTLLLLLLGRLTLSEGTQRVSRRLRIRGHTHVSPYPEVGMDVDKPHQLELVRRDLAGRQEAAGQAP